MNEKNYLPRQGVDGYTFEITSKKNFSPTPKIEMKSPHGTVFGTLTAKSGYYELFVCPPRYVRDTNEVPFGVSDLKYLSEMREEIKRVLKKEFPRGYYIDFKKTEVNITDTMVGKCRCENVFGLLCDSMIHHREQNILYVTQTRESVIDREIPGFVSRTIGNQWKLKCYDKQRQLDVEMGVQISEQLVRMEFILLSRKIQKMFGKDHSIDNIFSHNSVMLLINEYKVLMDNVIENYVKKHLSRVHEQLLEDLRILKSPTDVYCLRKRNIYDEKQMTKALKVYYKEQGREDSSRQVIHSLNRKFLLPKNTLDTIRKFHRQC